MPTKKKVAKKKLTLTDRQKVSVLTRLLIDIREKFLHEPDSDSREYCAGCERSPYNRPQHDADCLVPRVYRTLVQVGAGSKL